MSEAGNIIDLNAHRARRAAAQARRAPPGRSASYMLWYPSAGMALFMPGATVHANRFSFQAQQVKPLPEGA
jgi:hypothetical protein